MQGAKCTSSRGSSKSNLIEPSRTTELTEPSPMTALQGKQGVQGAICTSSGRFKRIEPHRTFSTHITTEKARCVVYWHKSSGWFDCMKHPLSTSLLGNQGVQGAYALVRCGSSTSNLLEPSRATAVQRYQGVEGFVTCVRGGSTVPNLLSLQGYRRNKVCRYLCPRSGWFKHIEPSRATSLQSYQGVEGFCHMRSGWFYHILLLLLLPFYCLFYCPFYCSCYCHSTAHSTAILLLMLMLILRLFYCSFYCQSSAHSTALLLLILLPILMGSRAVAAALVRGGSSAANLYEPSRTTSSQR